MISTIVLVLIGVGLSTAQITGPRCGEEVIQSRILGGNPILRCTWPYTPLVSIKIFYNQGSTSGFGNVTICGGAIINTQYILTSAICAAPLYGSQGAIIRQGTRVIVGDYDVTTTDIGNDGTAEDAIPVEDIKIHFNYNNITTDNNIAILKLASPIIYNNCKMPGCLQPQQVDSYDSTCDGEIDTTCIMASVGLRLQNATDTANIPQQAPVKMYSRAVTEAVMRATPSNILPEGAVLGETMDQSVQACLFDWGGIVVCRSSGTYFLRGLIGTNNCVLSNNPDSRPPPIFITEVAYYRNWIESCVNSFSTCISLPESGI